jgi:hypothetical protein
MIDRRPVMDRRPRVLLTIRINFGAAAWSHTNTNGRDLNHTRRWGTRVTPPPSHYRAPLVVIDLIDNFRER